MDQLTQEEKQNIIKLQTLLRENAPIVYQKYAAKKLYAEKMRAYKEKQKKKDNTEPFENWMKEEDNKKSEGIA